MTPEMIVALIVLVWVAFIWAVVRAVRICSREERERQVRDEAHRQFFAKYTEPVIPPVELDQLARERWID